MRTEGRPFYPELESLRGIAAFAVLGEHAFLRFQGPELVRFLDVDGPWKSNSGWTFDWIAATVFPGAASVALFFVLSGFVLGQTLNGSGQSRYDLFIVRRLFRILPALWLSIIIAAAIWNLFARPVSLVDVVQHLWLGEKWLNSPIWSLRAELVNSALLPLMCWACGRLNVSGQLAVLVGLIALSTHSSVLPGLGFSYAFWLGLLVPHGGRMLISRLDGRTVGMLLVTSVLFLCLSRTLALLSGMHIGRLIGAFSSFYIVSFLAYVPRGPLQSFMRSFPARYLGRISYSFYLLHYPVLDVISLGMVTLYGAEYWHSHAVPGQLLLFVLAIPTTVGVASVSYRFIEKPGIAAGKMFTSRMLAREKVVSFATPSPTRTKRPGESQTQFLAPSHSDLQS